MGSRQFGVWLVLLSVLQWISLFDLGVSAGARNEIARAVASNNPNNVRQAVTTGWWYVMVVSASLFALSALALTLTPAQQWLEQNVFKGVDAGGALWLVLTCACLSFGLGYIQSVFAALEKASAFSLFSLGTNVLFLALLALAKWFSWTSMAHIALLYLVAVVASNLWLIARFFSAYPHYTPRRASFDRTRRASIMNFGLRLFVVQLAALVIFTTSRLMASTLLGPESVVIYDAGFKLFSLITMIHTLIMGTLWSSFTQAYERKEMEWIRRSLIRLVQMMLPVVASCLVMAWIAPWLVSKWLGSSQAASLGFYLLFAAVTAFSCWSNIFAYFLNGIGDTKLQMFSAIIAGLINIPATYLFTVKFELGISGLLLGTLVSLSLFSILGPLKALQLVKKNHV
nr:oligosaccharide flippase family protein [Roseateles koreensis]